MQNGNLLYESKGCPKKQIIKHILNIIILLVLAVASIIVSVKLSEKIPFIGFGAFLSIIFIMCEVFPIIRFSRKTECWIRIYDNHIEGKAYKLGNTKNFSLFYNQIQSVQINNEFIVLFVGGKKYKMLCKDQENAFSIINNCIADLISNQAVR